MILSVISPYSDKVVTCSPDGFAYEWNLAIPSVKYDPVDIQQDGKSESDKVDNVSVISNVQKNPENPNTILNNNITSKN